MKKGVSVYDEDFNRIKTPYGAGNPSLGHLFEAGRHKKDRSDYGRGQTFSEYILKGRAIQEIKRTYKIKETSARIIYNFAIKNNLTFNCVFHNYLKSGNHAIFKGTGRGIPWQYNKRELAVSYVKQGYSK